MSLTIYWQLKEYFAQQNPNLNIAFLRKNFKYANELA